MPNNVTELRCFVPWIGRDAIAPTPTRSCWQITRAASGERYGTGCQVSARDRASCRELLPIIVLPVHNNCNAKRIREIHVGAKIVGTEDRSGRSFPRSRGDSGLKII